MSKMDCIYIAASARDARFTRICVASVRYFYPDIPIRILVGGTLQRGLAEELQRYWNVSLADFPRVDYGWGFIKLEPLFRPSGEHFMVLDSDTVFAGPVLEWADKCDADFVVDNEDLSEDIVSRMFVDVAKSEEEGNPVPRPKFVFNSGQWFGKSGLINREDFRGIVDWGSSPRLVNPRVFKNGEQGAFNFVVNEKHRLGKISVTCVPLMHWPEHGMGGFDVSHISSRQGRPVVVHWAGIKKARHRDIVGAELLEYFEKYYYSRLPSGETKRRFAALVHWQAYWIAAIMLRVRLRVKIIKRQLSALRQKSDFDGPRTDIAKF